MTTERIYRWEVALIAALVLAGVGVFRSNATALLAAIIPLTYVFIGSLSQAPPASSLIIERELDDTSPEPGEQVRVRLRIENDSTAALTDVRVIDAVPDDVTVVDGSPRAALSLRAGAEKTVEYTVVARHGRYEFDAPYVRLRTLTGTHRRTMQVPAKGDTAMETPTHLTAVPTRGGTHRHVGNVESATPGDGLDFHSVREYRKGDRLSRIDWRHYAETGSLTTVMFRQSRATTVLALVDFRTETRVTPYPGHPDGRELTAYASAHVLTSYLRDGHQVGAVCLGMDGTTLPSTIDRDDAGTPWIPPGSDGETRERITALLDAMYDRVSATDAEDEGDEPATDQAVRTPHAGGDTADTRNIANRILARLSDDTQVVILSPAWDRPLVALVRDLRMAGHAVTLLSPDVTEAPGTGATVAALERRARLDEIRATGTTAISWSPSDPLWTSIDTQRAEYRSRP